MDRYLIQEQGLIKKVGKFSLFILTFAIIGCNSGIEDAGQSENESVSKPSSFNIIAPLQDTVGAALTPTFQWENTNEEASYTLEVSANSEFTPPLVFSNSLLSMDQTTATITNNSLLPATSYYWRVLAVNALGSTIAANAPFLFTTGNIPNVFELISPLDGAQDVSLTPSLQWGAALNADKYILQVSQNSGFIAPITIEQTIVATSQDQLIFSMPANTLSMGATYYWRVIGVNSIGQRLSTSSFTFTTGVFPKVKDYAIFTDENRNGQTDLGDKILFRFDQNVTVTAASTADFVLPVSGDSFGTGATVLGGPKSDEVTITLGNLPRLKSRFDFNKLTLKSNSSSGIDVSSSLTANAIESTVTGADAAPSSPVDLIPGFVETTQAINDSSTIVTADIDSDGDLDLIVAYGSGQANQIWLNDGNGLFSVSNLVIGSSPGLSFAAGDLDGDGDLDIVAGNASLDSAAVNEIWLNSLRETGILAFTQLAVDLGSGSTRDVALGDLDKDGDLDIIFAKYHLSNKVWLNDLANSGTFIDSNLNLGTGTTNAIVIGDLDGDGDLDFIEGNDSAQTSTVSLPNKVWLNTLVESGSFGYSDVGQNMEDGFTASLALGDVDGDGDLDLVVGNRGSLNGQSNRVWLNDGKANFSSSMLLPALNRTYSISLYDMDGDGDLDVLEGNQSGDPSLIWQNNGLGIFTPTGHDIGADGCLRHAIGDFDNDSDPDFVCSVSKAASKIWLGSYSGSSGSVLFTASSQVLTQTNTRSLVLVDVDNDSDLDIVEGNDNGQENLLYLNNGIGNFTVSTTGLGTDITTAIAFGDLDGKGNIDLFFGNQKQNNRIWLNDYPNGFSATGQGFGGLDYTQAVAVGDLNNNGKLDVVVGNSLGEPNTIWLNDGSANFSDSLLILDSGVNVDNTNALALADFDNDGDVDILAGNGNSSNKMWLNQIIANSTPTGTLSFLDSSLVNMASVVEKTYAIVAVDVDRDGDLDFITGNLNQPNRVWLNQLRETGTLNFVDSGQLLGNNGTSSLAVGDVDNDGDMDFVSGNLLQLNRLWLNNGNGIFTDSGREFDSNALRTYAMSLGDIDHDGDLDLVEGAYGAPAIIYFNE